VQNGKAINLASLMACFLVRVLVISHHVGRFGVIVTTGESTGALTWAREAAPPRGAGRTDTAERDAGTIVEAFA
jgi:hypothetical protein